MGTAESGVRGAKGIGTSLPRLRSGPTPAVSASIDEHAGLWCALLGNASRIRGVSGDCAAYRRRGLGSRPLVSLAVLAFVVAPRLARISSHQQFYLSIRNGTTGLVVTASGDDLWPRWCGPCLSRLV